MRTCGVFAIVTMAAGLALAQSPAPQKAVALQSGSRINAQLKSRLDTQHAKVGDRVSAVTTSAVKEHGQTVLPKGAVLTGHITEVGRAQGHSGPAHIGVLFDQATFAHGQTVPLHAGIVSVVNSQADAAMNMNPPAMAMPMPMPQPMPVAGGGGGLLGGGGGLLGGTLSAAGGAAGGVVASAGGGLGAGMNAAGDGRVALLPPLIQMQADGELTSAAHASNGVPIELAVPTSSAAAGQNTEIGGVMSSSRGNFRLNSGTQVQLQQTGAAGGN